MLPIEEYTLACGWKLTYFDHIRPDVFEARINLLAQERRRDLMNVVDAAGVLGRESRSGCHGIAPMSGDDFLVGLETPSGGM